MTIVHDIVKQTPAVRQPQRKFLTVLFATILALRGRVTARNVSRSCAYSERTIARWKLIPPNSHLKMIQQALQVLLFVSDPKNSLIRVPEDAERI